MVSISSVIKQIKTGKPFELTWLTYDKNRKTGGEVRTAQARIASLKTDRQIKSVSYETQTNKKSRKPQHHEHGTYNIELLSDGHPTDIIRKIHWMLIVVFNGKKVYL